MKISGDTQVVIILTLGGFLVGFGMYGIQGAAIGAGLGLLVLPILIFLSYTM